MTVLTGVVAFKGGVGKTTLTTCLGLGLSTISKRSVLLVDFDPQANLTEALLTQVNILDAYRRSESYNLAFSYEALLQGREPLVYPISGVDNLYIIPSHPKYMLWAAQRVLEPSQDRIQFFRSTLGSIAERFNVDYVILDLPPQMYGIVVPIASVITDYIISPVIKGAFSIESVEYLIETYYNVARSYTKKPTAFLGAVLMKFSTIETSLVNNVKTAVQKRVKNSFDKLKGLGIVESVRYGDVFDSVIHYNRILTKLRNMPWTREPYIVRHIHGKFGGERSRRDQRLLLNDISSLAREFEMRIKEVGSVE
jgi:chromosome partitioning protein